jgi:membrane-associated phospholipid phosphatase
MSSRTWFYVRIGICLVLMVCIVEAGIWPLVYPPEHPPILAWWQSGWLALAGFIFGAPLWLVVCLLGISLADKLALFESASALAAFTYLYLIFLGLGRFPLGRQIQRKKRAGLRS